VVNDITKEFDYGICFRCQRLMLARFLTQIRFYEGHKRLGNFHHKLICDVCKYGADEIFEEAKLIKKEVK